MFIGWVKVLFLRFYRVILMVLMEVINMFFFVKLSVLWYMLNYSFFCFKVFWFRSIGVKCFIFVLMIEVGLYFFFYFIRLLLVEIFMI